MSSLDETLLAFARPALVPAGFRLGWRQASVRGLTLHEIVATAARHPASREVVLRPFGLSMMPDVEVDAAGMMALLDLVCTAVGRRDGRAVRTITRLSASAFATLLARIVALTTPPDMDEFFAPSRSGSDDEDDNRDDDDGAAAEPVTVLVKLALRLRPDGSALDWTPGRLLFGAAVQAERRRDESRANLMDTAVATRAGQFDEKGWKQFRAEIERA